MDFTAAGLADLLPGLAGVSGAEDALQGSGEEDGGVRRGLQEGADGLAAKGGGLLPGAAGVIADPQAAFCVLPCGDVESVVVGGVDNDVVDHQTVLVA